MRGAPHALIGAAAATPVMVVAGPAALIPVAVCGALGGLLPDIDHPHSMLGRWIPWPGYDNGNGNCGRWGLFGKIAHRDQMHSVFVGLGFAFAYHWFLNWLLLHIPGWLLGFESWLVGGLNGLLTHAPQTAGFQLPSLLVMTPQLAGTWALWGAVALFFGFCSHLFADMLNPTPQMLFWPLSGKRWRPRLLPSFRSSGIISYALETLASAAALWLMVSLLIAHHS